MANKPKIKTKEHMVKKEGEKREKTTTLKFLKRKLRQVMSASNGRDKGWVHVIRVHDTTHSAVTTTWQCNRCS